MNPALYSHHLEFAVLSLVKMEDLASKVKPKKVATNANVTPDSVDQIAKSILILALLHRVSTVADVEFYTNWVTSTASALDHISLVKDANLVAIAVLIRVNTMAFAKKVTMVLYANAKVLPENVAKSMSTSANIILAPMAVLVSTRLDLIVAFVHQLLLVTIVLILQVTPLV